jgi:hypothetical protein
MTQGYLCNGLECGTFITGQPAGSYQHRCVIVPDDDPAKASTIIIDAHLCSDCAIDLSRQLALLPEGAAADSRGE